MGFLTIKYVKFIIHVSGSENNPAMRLFFSNPSEMEPVHFLHKIMQVGFEYKLLDLEDILHG